MSKSLVKSLERRKIESLRSTPLPTDFLKMVTDVFKTNFDEGLKKISKLTKDKIRFQAVGEVHPEEIILCVTLVQEKSLSATSVYASVDFDPKASAPTIQDLLPLCVDAIGAVYQPLLSSKDPKTLEGLVEGPLSKLNDIPFEWTVLQIEKNRIYVKMDKANPLIDQMADEWLSKHDPEIVELEEQEEEETKDLFVTGVKKPGRNTGTLH
jgi:hypothetical protein